MRIIWFAIVACLTALPPLHAQVDLSAAPMARVQAAEIVILGEIHDNPAHHQGQARLIGQIAPRAVVFEMLSPAQADLFNTAPRTDLAALADQAGWADAGWPEFDIYRPVFEALGQAPVVGAALPRDSVRAAFDRDAASVFGSDAPRFGLDTPLPQTQQEARAALQFAAHCEAMPMHMMGGMVEAQRLRDAQFSAAALSALDRFGAPVVVITGNGHARKDWGMPALIAHAAPQVRVFSIGFVETPADGDDPRYDATIVTAAAERPDPCAAFRN